jgi:hypothetical protein
MMLGKADGLHWRDSMLALGQTVGPISGTDDLDMVGWLDTAGVAVDDHTAAAADIDIALVVAEAPMD